jgi:cyanophycinase
MRRYPLLLAVILIAFLALPVRAQNNPREPLLIPIGGGVSDIAPEFIDAAIRNARQGKVEILILPVNLASDSMSITEAERRDILSTVEEQRKYLEQVCQDRAPKTLLCHVITAPILTRKDATDPDMLKGLTPDLAAIYLPDGDKAIGVDVIGGTPLEYQLSRVYDQGVIVAGNGAGGAIQSNPMIGTIRPDSNPSDALNFGAVQVWDTAEQHGLLFGIKEAMIEDRFFQGGKFGWLLNAIALPNIPNVGIGIDEDTGVMIPSGDKLENIFGSNSITILDAETYHSADAVQYIGPENITSLRNILVHTLAPGDFSYDLFRKRHSLGAPYQQLARTFEGLSVPPGAGPLILTGDLANSSSKTEILDRFTELSGGTDANILVLAGGYSTKIDGEQAGAEIANLLKANSQVSVLSKQPGQSDTFSQDYSGIILSVDDPGKIDTNTLSILNEAWMQGVPILADNGATSLIGSYFIPRTMNDANGENIPNAIISPSLTEETATKAGLGLLNGTFVSRILEDNRWGELISLAYQHPDLLSVGLSQDSAIEINQDGARSAGDNATFVMDFRKAVLDLGTNDQLVAANGLLDVFAPGQSMQPEPADISAAPERLATPVLITPSATPSPTLTPRPTFTPTITITPTQSPVPTKRVRPTSTPIIIPPPSDPVTRNMMVTFGVSIVLVIILGIWINRHRIN